MANDRPDLTFQEFEKLLAGAFLPYQCHFKSIDHGSGFEFTLIDNGASVLGVSYHRQSRISDKRARSVISQTRKHLFRLGRKLDPWRFPERAIQAI